MATAIDFPERNDYMGKPATQSNNQCYALPICRILTYIPGVIPSAHPISTHAHISFWEFSEQEIAEVIKNKGCYLKVMGVSTFPLSIHGINPIIPDSDKIFTEEELIILKKP